ncbi:MAG: alpha/beta fold hydrolase [Pseudonocardiaceae bacterium]
MKAAGAVLWVLSRISPRLAGRLAVALFGITVRARVRAAEQEVHRQAKTKTIVVNGRDVAVYWWGDGSNPVLLAHGWGGRSSNYAGLIPKLLDRGLSAVAFDMPGHGDSGGKSTDLVECAEIIRCIQAQFGPFHAVVAHSFGSLATFHAVRTGVTTGRIVTINGVCDLGYLIEVFGRNFPLTDRVRQELRRRIEQHFAPEHDVWRRLCASHVPAAFDVPILVIHDADDQMIDFSQAERIVAAHAPRATLMATSRLGHRRVMASLEVIDAVVEFVTAPAVELAQD